MLWTVLARLAAAHRRRRDPIGYCRSLGVRIGRDCRLIDVTAATFGSEPYLVSLGDHVTVTSGVRFVTHDGGVWVFRRSDPDLDVIAPIRVGNNVFLGLNSIILPGVSIGDDCVIGAGSVVNRDIPSGFVAAGVPARTIKTIREYYENVAARSCPTKVMDFRTKRRYLERRFGLAGTARSCPDDSRGPATE